MRNRKPFKTRHEKATEAAAAQSAEANVAVAEALAEVPPRAAGEDTAAIVKPAAELQSEQTQDAARFAVEPPRAPVAGIDCEVRTEPIPVDQIGTILDQSVGLGQSPAPMPQSNTPVAAGQYQGAPNTSPDPISGAVKDPSASLMPSAPATLVPGKIVSIAIEVAEFEDRRGSLDYIVRVNVGGKVHVIRKQIGIHHFRGYFATVWDDLGEHFKRAVEAATN